MATKTTDKQQIHVVTDANFNHNKLINAKIDAKENEITNLPSGGNVDDVKVNNTSVVENKIASINLKTINRQSIVGSGNIDVEGGGSNLNEFVITQEIFDEYKNENNYADLADIIDSEEITQNVINLNNFNYFLTGLVVSNKTLIFKNGTVVFGTSGINDSIDKAITASNCKLGFIDCEIIVNDSITTEPEKPIIDLNNTNLTFDNVIADNFTFTTFKTFIQTTNTCNIVLKDTLFDIIDKLINYDPEEDEKKPSMKFIKVLTNGSSVKFINSMIDISTEKLINNINPGLCQNIIVETIGLVTVKIEILNSILQLHAEGGHGEGGISSRPARCLDVNLDNLDVKIINSLLDHEAWQRTESSYGLEPNKSFTTNDPYMVFFEPDIDIFQGDDEAEDYEPKFENININKYLFVNTVEYIEGDYHFTYNGSGWDVTANSFDEDDTITRTLDTNITIEQIEEKYGLTFDLIEGKVLEQDDDITLELVLDSSCYKILKNFTTESNSEEYLNELNYNIGEVTDLAEEIEKVNYDNEKFANALAEVLERNDKHLRPHREYDEEQDIETDVMAKIGFWYDEDNDDPNVWKIEIDPEWIEEDEHLMDDVDLRDFGLEVIIKDQQEIHNLSGFTVVVEPLIEKTKIYIKEIINSMLPGGCYNTDEDFPNLEEDDQPNGIFSGKEPKGFSQFEDIKVTNIKSQSLITTSENYYLPVDNENLESNNVKDAINELADKGTLSEKNAGFSISIHGDYGRSGDKIYYDGLDIQCDGWNIGDGCMFGPGNEIDFNDTPVNATEGSLIFRNGQLLDLDDYTIDNNLVTFNEELQEGDIVAIINGWTIFKKITGFTGTELEIDFNFEQRVLVFKNGILLSQNSEEENDYYYDDGKLIFTTELKEDDKLVFVRINGIVKRKEYSGGETQIFIDRDDILLFRDGILQGQSSEDEEGQLPENYDYVIKDNPSYHEDGLISNAEFMNDDKIELETGTIIPVDENERIIFIAVDDLISEEEIDKILIKITKHEQEDDEPITIFEKRLSEFEDYEHEEEGPNILYYIQVKDLDINELLPEGNYSFTLEGIYEDEEDEELFRIEFNTSLEDGNIIFNIEPYSINEPYMIQFQDALENCNLTILDKGISGGIFNTLSDKQDKLTEQQLNNINNPYKPLIFTNIEANDWYEDDTFEDYGYKCELECEGVNENMFAQVVFGIEEANSGNYASVCDTAENKVIIYSKVNDTITIPTIVIMEA